MSEASPTVVEDISTDSTGNKEELYLKWREKLRHILVTRKDEDPFFYGACFHGTCAVSDPIPSMPPMHPIVTVECVGRIGLPLCDEQAASLKKSYEPVSEQHASCWEVANSNVSVKETLKWEELLSNVVKTATGRMGLEQETLHQWGIKPSFHKLLMYEAGGESARPWEDCTASDKRVIGTLLFQLPSKFDGGDMKFQYNLPEIPREESVTLKNAEGSDETFVFSAFFNAYSRLELAPIVSGRRLCLMYNIVVTREPSPGETFTIGNWIAQNFREVCALPIREVAEAWDDKCPPNQPTQACLLQGHYTEQNLAIGNLNEEDKDTIQLLKDATDSAGSPLFNTALLLMFKHEFLFNSKQHQFGTKLWVTAEGHRVESDIFNLDWFNSNVLQVTTKNDLDHAAFWADCTNKTERHHSGTTLSQYSGQPATFYRSMVVFWPRSKDVQVACLVSFPLAISALAKERRPEGLQKAKMVLDLAERCDAFSKKSKEGWNHPAAETIRVLESFGRDASPLMARAFRLVTNSCGLQDKDVIKAVTSAVGWMCSEEVDLAAEELINASVADCERIDWSKFESKYPDGKDRKEFFRKIYLTNSLTSAEEVMKNDKVAIRFVECAAGHDEFFPMSVDAILKHAKPALLTKLIDAACRRRRMDCPHILRLCTTRLEQIYEEIDKGPSFSWRQSRATFPSYEEHSEEVLNFLRGPKECTCIHGFDEPKDAQVWGQLHFGGNLKDRMRLYHFSVEFEAYQLDDGRCIVMLTKTKEVSLKEMKRKKKELQEERALLEKIVTYGQNEEPPDKRLRL